MKNDPSLTDHPTSMRLDRHTRLLLEALARKLATSRAAVVRMAVRELAARLGITVIVEGKVSEP